MKLIERLLDEEQANKASAQARGLAVITTSGTLVTLLLAFAALATRKQSTFTIPSSAKAPLVTASILFVVAAILGLIVNTHLRRTEGLDYTNMGKVLTEKAWTAPPVKVVRLLYEDQLAVLNDAHNLNTLRARILTSAIAFEIAGIACAAWAAISLIATG